MGTAALLYASVLLSLLTSEITEAAIFLPFGDGDTINPPDDDGGTEFIFSQQPFKYFGRIYNKIFINNNGQLTFTESLTESLQVTSGIDVIAPLWTDFDNTVDGTIYYREETNSSTLAEYCNLVRQQFPNLTIPFTATSAFVATWDSVSYFSEEGVATFQVALLFNNDHSFILFSYATIANTNQDVAVGYYTVDSANSFTIPFQDASELQFKSNVNITGSFIFHVYDVCDTLGCTKKELCQNRKGVYGCGCLEEQRLTKNFDSVEFCGNGTGSISLSQCQLFESGFPADTLHLSDPNCTGTLENGRVVFKFYNESQTCGTTLTTNHTHFIYQNSIQSNLGSRNQIMITRESWLNITFSCVYPLIQTLSMPMSIHAEQSVVNVNLPGQGTYKIHMILYHDAQFTSPYNGEVEVQANQQIYVAVEVKGVDRDQIATVLDNCWTTPVNDIDYHIRWNLISNECPDSEDSTVKVLQNGNDTTSRFSFRMFTFTGISDRIFLHCQVHLCLVQNGRCVQSCNIENIRRRRSSDLHHSTAITMGL